MVSMIAAVVGSHDGVMADDPAARPRRRRFSAEDKLAILAEDDRLTEPGDKGALLRREAWTAPTSWSGVALGMAGRCPGWPPRAADRGGLRSKSSWSGCAAATSAWRPSWPHQGGVGDRGEAHALLGQLSESADSEPRSSR
jgi:transposase